MALTSYLVLSLRAVVDTVTPEIDRYAIVVTWALQVSQRTFHSVVRPRPTVRVGSEVSSFVKVDQCRGKLSEVHPSLCRVLAVQFILSFWTMGVFVTRK